MDHEPGDDQAGPAEIVCGGDLLEDDGADDGGAGRQGASMRAKVACRAGPPEVASGVISMLSILTCEETPRLLVNHIRPVLRPSLRMAYGALRARAGDLYRESLGQYVAVPAAGVFDSDVGLS